MKWLIGLAVALACGVGVAATLRGNDENCMYLAYNFDNMAGYRDSGVGWLEAKQQVIAAIADSMTNPNGLVKDQDDALFAMGLADRLWNKDLASVPPGLVGVRVYDICMGKDGKKKVML